MKTITSILFSLVTLAALADTNVLELTWIQPAGYQSTLYESDDLTGSWTSLGVVSPPVNTHPTNLVTFFYVSVVPTNNGNGPVLFSFDPNAESVIPANPTNPAIAYSLDLSRPVYFWNNQSNFWQ